VVTGSSGSWTDGDDERDASGSGVMTVSAASSSSPSDPYSEAMQAAESYASSMMGTMLPTMTIEVILEPTQVSSLQQSIE